MLWPEPRSQGPQVLAAIHGNGHVSARRDGVRAVPGVGLGREADESLDGQGSGAADDLDEVVRAWEDAVAVVDGDVGEMLDEVISLAERLERLGDPDRVLPDLKDQLAGEGFRDAVVVLPVLAVQRVGGPPVVRLGVSAPTATSGRERSSSRCKSART